MRNNFAAMILTHGRPNKVPTYRTLRKNGYTGRIVIVVDNEDDTVGEYRKQFGDQVYVFDKAAVAQTFDQGDNFDDRRAIVYARNASFSIAEELGIESFIQLDDDYNTMYYVYNKEAFYGNYQIDSLDWLFDKMVDYLKVTPFASIAMSQSGDHLGGKNGSYGKSISTLRKAMNSFVCLTNRPFQFTGRVNEDVNTYTCSQRRGVSFLTLLGVKLNQTATQLTPGGMTELYLDSGTYTKSFYSVMYAPSAVRIAMMKSATPRIHHQIHWNAVAPLIVREEWRK